MNYLAHLFLSGPNEGILVGNFIADFVKGKAKDNYPDEIRSGIELHRQIDDFTDHHAINSISKQRLYPTQGKYAPVVVDMFYDHFLAKNFSEYSGVGLNEFAQTAYTLLQKNHHHLPEKVRGFLHYMIERNWLLNYASVEGICKTLKGMSSRVNYPNRMDNAEKDLIQGYSDFEKEFRDFFPELITFAAAKR